MQPFEIDPITGRPIMGEAPLPPRVSPFQRVVQGLGSGVRSVLAPRSMVGSSAAPPQAAAVDAYSAAEFGSPPNFRPYQGPDDGAPMFDPTMQPPPNQGALYRGPGDGAPMFDPSVTPVAPTAPQPPAAAPQAPPGAAVAPAQAAPRAPTGPLPNGGVATVGETTDGVAPRPPGALADPTDRNAFATNLMARESGGRLDVVNPLGYAGLFQFGAPRLQELGFYTPGRGERLQGWGQDGDGRWTGQFRIPGFENVRTLQDFLGNEGAQRAVFERHVEQIDAAIDALPNANALDRNGLRAVAHLGGVAGMRRFAASGGEFDPADANGTRLSDYYRTFSGGSAAPTRPMTPGAGPAAGPEPTLQEPPTGALSMSVSDPAAQPQGVSGDALMAAGAGMLSGRDLREGMANASMAFIGQRRNERGEALQASQLASARADRQASAAELAAYRRAQLAIQQQRANTGDVRAANAAGSGSALETRGQPIQMVDPSTRQAYTRITLSNGDQITRGPDGNVVTDAEVLRRLEFRQDAGTGRLTNESVDANVPLGDGILTGGANARASAANIERLRALATQEGAMGPEAVQAAQRFIVRMTGMQLGSVTPQGLALTEQQIDEFVSTRLPELVRELRPVSNIDAETVRRALLTARTQREAMTTLLDVFEAPVRRQARMAEEWTNLDDPVRAAILRRPNGVNLWMNERRRVYDEEGFFPGVRLSPNPNTTTNPPANPAGQGPWQSRTSSGIGFSFN